MDLLNQLHRDGATISMVSHDPRYAQYAERQVQLFDGRIVEAQQPAGAESLTGKLPMQKPEVLSENSFPV